MAYLRNIAAAGLQLSLLAQSVSAAPKPKCDDPTLGAVASESAVCSHIGTDLLEAGGNAADAIVGTVFCVGVIGMYHSGIGGGGFALVRSNEGKYVSSFHIFTLIEKNSPDFMCVLEMPIAKIGGYRSSSTSERPHPQRPLKTCTRTTPMPAYMEDLLGKYPSTA